MRTARAWYEARYVAGGCWVFSNITRAHACTRNGTCPGWASAYPYKGNAPTSLVTLYYGFDPTAGVGSPNIANLDCLAEEGSGCCGAQLSNAGCGYLGASVVQYQSWGVGCSFDRAYTSAAHELGHNLGLSHDTSFPYNFMKAAGQIEGTDLNAANTAQLEAALESPTCGRRPGFEWNSTPNDPGEPCSSCP